MVHGRQAASEQPTMEKGDTLGEVDVFDGVLPQSADCGQNRLSWCQDSVTCSASGMLMYVTE